VICGVAARGLKKGPGLFRRRGVASLAAGAARSSLFNGCFAAGGCCSVVALGCFGDVCAETLWVANIESAIDPATANLCKRLLKYIGSKML
jgi:hypothetical protein